MPARIQALIAQPDNWEIIRDEIAAILLVESASQQEFARAVDEDPDQWRLRVFLERSNPWEEWQGDSVEDTSPIVNVAFETSTSEGGNAIDKQRAAAVYNIDCYGYGISCGTAEGHESGDARAAIESHRAARLVRRILMADVYTYLGLPRGASQFVSKRMWQSVTTFQPQIEGKSIQHVVGTRVTFRVDCVEFASQYQAPELQFVSLTVKRAETGELLMQADYPLV